MDKAAPSEDGAADKARRRRRTLIIAGIAALAAGIAIVAFVASGRFTGRNHAASLGSRTQLTVSGNVLEPAISPDGKQLAYVTKHCVSGSCTFSVVVQDVGGTASRTILEGATGGYALAWSPDRRNLAFQGTIGNRSGSYLLSALGGTPRFLVAGPAAFYAGGDSLLLGPTRHPDSVFWIRVTTLDGVARDSIRVAGPGQGLTSISVVPGTSWIVTLVLQEPRGLWQVIDRNGQVADRVVNDCTCGGTSTSDAVWLARSVGNDAQAIVRIPIDRSTGRLAAQQDTMITGLFTSFSLTADGGGMVMDDGTYDFSAWALEVTDILEGRFPDDRRLLHASSAVNAFVSPDGIRLILRRTIPTSSGRAERRYTVMPFPAGDETPLSGPGSPVGSSGWTDSVRVGVVTQRPGGLRFAEVDVRTGAQSNALEIPDSVIVSFGALADGWVWIPATRDRLKMHRSGSTREIPKPGWYADVRGVTSDTERNRIFFWGFSESTGDSVGVSVLRLSDGAATQWASGFGRRAEITPLADGTALLQLVETQESITFFKLSGPGQIRRIGTSPRPLRSASIAADLKRATAIERDYRADAWLSKVIRSQ